MIRGGEQDLDTEYLTRSALRGSLPIYARPSCLAVGPGLSISATVLARQAVPRQYIAIN